VSKPHSGDVEITANIDFVGAGVDPHRKAGLMIRQSMETDSPYIDVILHGDGLTSLQYRDESGGQTKQLEANVTMPEAVKLELIDGYAYMSVKGETDQWVKASGSVKTDITSPYNIGLALSSHNNEVTETAIFSNLELAPRHAMAKSSFLMVMAYSIKSLLRAERRSRLIQALIKS